ncbi:Outer membrane protein Omp4 [Helicobacter ailurogastricus]|nr:outer membrane beta-barrel protein [Helicobacter ailurogastricus]GMB91257.1 Outer membrane protein Omp4 [Helicobacter ailurogastricus]
MKRTIVAIPLATALLGAADEPKPVQSPTPEPSQAVQMQKPPAPASTTQSPAPAPSQATQAQTPLPKQEAQKTIPARVRVGTTRHGERNAFFVGADYQLGMMTSTEQGCASSAQCDGNRLETNSEISWGDMGTHHFKGALNAQEHVTNGFGIVAGYKHFFKKLPEIGLRYYGFFDYAASNYRYYRNISNINAWEGTTYKPTNIFAYGIGTDVLFNPKRFNKENFHFGFFAGLAIGGSSFGPMNGYYKSLVQIYGGHLRVSSFNVFVNGGIRFGTKHNGFEVGIKIPTIATHYYTALNVPTGYPYQATLQRDFVFYWRYLVSF